MKNKHILIGLTALWIGSGGCGGIPTAQPRQIELESFRIETGKVTESDLVTRLPRVLARHGYTIERYELHGRQVYMETQWKRRDAFEDEKARGAEGAATRLRFSARWNGRLYVLRMAAQNRILSTDGSMHEGSATERFRDYLDTIADDVRVSLSNTMRRH